MLSRWSKAVAQLSRSGSQVKILGFIEAQNAVFSQNYANVAAASMPSSFDSAGKSFDSSAVATVGHSILIFKANPFFCVWMFCCNSC